MKYLNLFDCLPRKRNDLWFQLSTPAVYSQLPPCGHLAITDSSEIPSGESYRRLTEINSRYYGLSLLRTSGHFIRSQCHNFFFLSRYSGHRATSWNTCIQIKSIFSAFWDCFCLFWSISASSFHQSKFLHLFLVGSSLQSRCHE